MNAIDLLLKQIKGHESAELLTYETIDVNDPHTVQYEKLRELGSVQGLPVAFVRNKEDGKLYVTFEDNNHVLIVGATGSGKTTGYIVILLHILAELSSSSLVISDPKGELYRDLAKKFEDRGYKVRTLNFRNPSHSDYWNPFTKLFRMWQKAHSLADKVELVMENGKEVYVFNGKKYKSLKDCDKDYNEVKELLFAEAENELSNVANMFVSEDNKIQPDWQRSARTVFKGLLHAMLEDSIPNGNTPPLITEYNFSIKTMIKIFDSFYESDCGEFRDGGYFTKRRKTEKSYQLVRNLLLNNAPNTRRGVLTTIESSLEAFRGEAVTRVMSANSFDIDTFDDEKVAIFIQYSDEREENYQLIELFMLDLYSRLVKVAERKGGILSRPFYFVWDEFGNFPAVPRFGNMMTACRSRNIWLILVLQDYAQLEALYEPAVAKAIKNNANIRMFYGTNDLETMRKFSAECLETTTLSPLTALNGKTDSLDGFNLETVPLVCVSDLNTLQEGVCYVKCFRKNPMKSWFERSYKCPEFKYEQADITAYTSGIRLSDAKYSYKLVVKPDPFDF